MINNIDPNGVICIKQGGYYYNVSGNDALILHKYLNYKLYGVKTVRTGFPVNRQDSVLKKIDNLIMNYDLIDQKGNILISKRYPNNFYEIVDAVEYNSSKTESYKNASKTLNKRPWSEKLSIYIKILEGLGEGVNLLTGEVISGIDEELKSYFFEMSMYFDNKLKTKEKLEEKYPNLGKKWTMEDDKQLIEQYNAGKSVKDLSNMYRRSTGAIRSRLLKLGVHL